MTPFLKQKGFIMNSRHKLTDEQWHKIKDYLLGKDGHAGRRASNNRLFIDAIIWAARTGAPWRDLPPEFGKWSSVHKRFTRWSKKGVWQMIFIIPWLLMKITNGLG